MKNKHTSWCECKPYKKKQENAPCLLCGKPFERYSNGRMKPCKCSKKTSLDIVQ